MCSLLPFVFSVETCLFCSRAHLLIRLPVLSEFYLFRSLQDALDISPLLVMGTLQGYLFTLFLWQSHHYCIVIFFFTDHIYTHRLYGHRLSNLAQPWHLLLKTLISVFSRQNSVNTNIYTHTLCTHKTQNTHTSLRNKNDS